MNDWILSLKIIAQKYKQADLFLPFQTFHRRIAILLTSCRTSQKTVDFSTYHIWTFIGPFSVGWPNCFITDSLPDIICILHIIYSWDVTQYIIGIDQIMHARISFSFLICSIYLQHSDITYRIWQPRSRNKYQVH